MTNQKQQTLVELKSLILDESKNVASFVLIGETLHKLYYEDKLVKNQKEFLQWTKQNLGFSKSTTYEYIISYKVYNEIVSKLPQGISPPLYQSHCQLLAKVPSDMLIETWVKVNQIAPNGVITTVIETNKALLESYISQMDIRPKKKTTPTKRKVVKEEEEAFYTPKKRIQPIQHYYNPNYSPLVRNDLSNSVESALELVEEEPKVDQAPADTDSITETEEEVVQNRSPRTRKDLPFDKQKIYALAHSLIHKPKFDIHIESPTDFNNNLTWHGDVFCDLLFAMPFSKAKCKQLAIEKYLSVIFTKYANKEYDRGLFLIRGEFGADWFKPITEQPYCVLRHTSELSGEFVTYVCFYMGVDQEAFMMNFKSAGYIPGYQSWAWTNKYGSPMARSFVSPSSNFVNLGSREYVREYPALNESEKEDTQSEFGLEFLNVSMGVDLSKAASALCHLNNEKD